MSIKLMKSLLLVAPLLASYHSFAQDLDGSDSVEISTAGLQLDASNPLTPYALKNNGKARKKFKVPYSVLKQYYEQFGQGTIVENPAPGPLLNLDLKPIENKSGPQLDFVVDLSRRKAYPAELINPHSVNHLFMVDPIKYIQEAKAQDFLSAKRKIYASKNFDRKVLRFDKNMVQLEDWRSLNHPPVDQLGDDLTIWDKELTPIDYSTKESVFYSEGFQKKVDEISKTELTFGNKLELLPNGKSFERKLAEIKKAKSSVLIAVMSIFCDPTSRELEDAVIEKIQKDKIDVKIMVEKVWTKVAMKRCLNRMIDGGADVVYASDLLKKDEEKALFHNKFMVIDESKVIMGGSNIVESDNISTGFNHMNRDNDVYVEGPIANDAMKNYAFLWRKYAGSKNELNKTNPRVRDISYYENLANQRIEEERASVKRGAENYSKILNDSQLRNQGVCRFVIQNPDTDKHKLTKVFMEHIDHAEHKLNLTTGSIYFDLPTDKPEERARDTWNKKLFRSIFAATGRGVKLDLIGNGIDGGYGEASNMINRITMKSRFKFKPVQKFLFNMLTRYLDSSAAEKNQPYLEYVQKQPNTRAWSNFQYMHSKLIQIDRVVSMVSSYNLEEWSADKSHEMSLVCMDETLNKQMDRSFVKDFANSVPVSVK